MCARALQICCQQQQVTAISVLSIEGTEYTIQQHFFVYHSNDITVEATYQRRQKQLLDWDMTESSESNVLRIGIFHSAKRDK